MRNRSPDSIMHTLSMLGTTVAQGSRFVSWSAEEGLKMRMRTGLKEDTSDTPGLDVMLALSGQWVDSGLPVVSLSPKRMQNMLEHTPHERPRSPWPAWALRLPRSQAVSLIDSENEIDCVELVFAVCVSERWSYMVFGQHVEYIELSVSPEDMRDGVIAPSMKSAPDAGMEVIPLTPHDITSCKRIQHLILMASLGVLGISGITRLGTERAAELKGLIPAGDYLLTHAGYDRIEWEDHGVRNV